MSKDNELLLGDMTPEDFRRYGHRTIDWIADYLAETEQWPVLSRSDPGEIKSQIAAEPPQTADTMDSILDDFERVILPGITHWNHPAFFAYFSITGSAAGILGELLCSALNVNAMLWKTSPAATELEETTLGWLRQMLGLPDDFWGIIYDTASTSTLHALAAARETVPGLNAREKGLCNAGRALRVYASEQAHSSVEKAAIAAGIGRCGVQSIAVDEEYRMEPRALEEAIESDRREGYHPFCVVATVGTTSTTSVDPVPEIAQICEQHRLWLHVDAAYAGAAALLPEMRWVLKGCERADSLVTNPHKWLFTPIDLSAFYCRRPEVLRRAFTLTPEYLRTREGESVTNYMDYGVSLGRRFRALKLWMVIRYFGHKGLQERVRQHVTWAAEFAEWIDASHDFERMAPTPFSTVCFRAIPKGLNSEALDHFNEVLLAKVNESGEVYLSHTRLRGSFTLRLAIGNLKTRREHLDLAKEMLIRALKACEHDII
jgi:aromatic-L-amino-acid decarboxylase